MEKDKLSDALDQYRECADAWSVNLENAREDLRFARLGEQWPEEVLQARRREKRPALTINRLPAFIRQIVNDARQNKPQIRVRPVEGGDVATAQIINGIIRNIEATSDADVAYDTAADHAASCGFGFVRVDVDYACDDSFEQDILIKRIANPLTVLPDYGSSEADSSDWDLCFVTTEYKRAEFTRMWPKANIQDWDAGSIPDGWISDEMVRVAERWQREKVKRKIVRLSDGRIIGADDLAEDIGGFTLGEALQAGGIVVVGERETKTYKVTQDVLSGGEILEEGNEWAGRYIPIIPVYGEEINIDGDTHYRSLIRDAKDSQQRYNYWITATTEMVALQPRAPFIGPKGAFKSDRQKWLRANSDNIPFLEYDGDTAPQRQMPPTVPSGMMQEAMVASDEMKAIIGIYDAALGARSNETSGRAINARQRESDTATFHFIDNLNRGIRHTARVVLDLIPHVYNTDRILRIIGDDGQSKEVRINGEVQEGEQVQLSEKLAMDVGRIYDITTGKYDLVVEAGPSFTTKREEAVVAMTEAMRSWPNAAPILLPHIAKNSDWPGADDIREELKGQQDPEKQQMQQQIMQMGEQLRAMQEEKSIDARKVEIDAYKAETDRLQLIQNQPMTPQQVQALVMQTLQQALTTPDIAP